MRSIGGAAASGSMPAAPTLEVVNDGTGSSVTAAVTGDASVTNTLYYQLDDDTEWTEGESRSGDGDILQTGLTVNTWYSFIVISDDSGVISLPSKCYRIYVMVGEETSPYNQGYPFENVTVDNLLRGNAQIFWTLDSEFTENSPYVFVVQWGRAGTDSWTTVATVTDTYYAVDTTARDTGAILEGFYRVVLTTADGGNYTSKPSMYPTQWASRDFRFAEEIKRREELSYRSDYGGIDFWILLRKNYGTLCTNCTNALSGEVNVSRCSVCYGTGRVGGYHPPYKTTGLIMMPVQQSISQSELGTMYAKKRIIRCCPLPVVTEEDYVVLAGSDVRMEVERVEVVAEIKGVPVIQHLICSAAPPSNSVYDLVLGGITGGSPTGISSDWTE